MRAAIAGDVIGSRFERSVWAGNQWADARCTGYDRPPVSDATGATADGFELFHPDCHVTDDSVLTIAVMDWLLNGGDPAGVFRAHFRRCGCQDRFGKFFRRWAEADTAEPCGSFGNGAAMRVGPVGFAADDADAVVRLARESAVPTHATPDAVAGAEAVALGVFRARTGTPKADLAAEITARFGYDLSRSLDDVRPGYTFSSRCDDTVPLAFRAVMEAAGYEDAIRRVISVGGDADTTACMAGAVAGAYWGTPKAVADAVEARLDPESLAIVRAFEARYPDAIRFGG